MYSNLSVNMIVFLLLLVHALGHPCLVNDNDDNIYLFGTDHGDLQLLKNDLGNPIKMNALDRPDFGLESVKCFFEQYSNSAIFIDSDSRHPFDLMVFSFISKSWKRIPITFKNSISFKDMTIILDHNTVTLYGLYDGLMHHCPIDINNSTVECKVLTSSVFSRDYDRNAVIGFGQNHLHFINDASLRPGEAKIFVIHYSWWQPQVQLYSGPMFPQIRGKTVSFPKSDNSVPLIFGFIPDDQSGTFIIDTNVQGSNSTLKFPPSVSNLDSMFVATTSTLVQVTSKYEIYTLDISSPKSQWIHVKSTILSDHSAPLGNHSVPLGDQSPVSSRDPSKTSYASITQSKMDIFCLIFLIFNY